MLPNRISSMKTRGLSSYKMAVSRQTGPAQLTHLFSSCQKTNLSKYSMKMAAFNQIKQDNVSEPGQVGRGVGHPLFTKADNNSFLCSYCIWFCTPNGGGRGWAGQVLYGPWTVLACKMSNRLPNQTGNIPDTCPLHGQSNKIFCLWFFRNGFFPSPLLGIWRVFKYDFKFVEILRSWLTPHYRL